MVLASYTLESVLAQHQATCVVPCPGALRGGPTPVCSSGLYSVACTLFLLGLGEVSDLRDVVVFIRGACAACWPLVAQHCLAPCYCLFPVQRDLLGSVSCITAIHTGGCSG
jgi:hypothetical protein